MTFICQSNPSAVLTDEALVCHYRDIPAVFTKLAAFFAEQGIGLQDGVVLDCENSLPSALVLLFLLEHGYHFLLSKPENSDKSPPKFCRYQLQIQASSLEPSEFLTVIDHPANSISPVGEEPKLYLRTSGSTGEPKIIVHTHAKLLGNITMCVQRLGINAATRMALPVPISHMFGLGAGFLPGISVGASIDLQKGANIIRFLQREKEFDPNTIFMTPIFCESLLKGRKSPRPYQLTVVAGDRLRAGVFNQYESLFGCLVQLYGSTEMGAIAAGNPLDTGETRRLAVGLPMPDVQIRIDKTTAQVSDDSHDSGEIWCKRSYGFSECWDQHGQTTGLEQIDGEGWFGTRDLGRLLQNGTIEVIGRCDHSIKRDGLLVMFADVEAALLKIAGVEATAVVASGESLRGKGLWAFCVIAEDSGLDSAAIRSCCFDLLPKRAIPDKVLVLETMPQLPNGKLDRRTLLKLSEQ
ncbi:MAG: class I adenylate-forming enzyme family protein [Methylococcales bacterium]|nr:class I adenylate-forming enzyme family protein [Methylococcales bacterium]